MDGFLGVRDRQMKKIMEGGGERGGGVRCRAFEDVSCVLACG